MSNNAEELERELERITQTTEVAVDSDGIVTITEDLQTIDCKIQILYNLNKPKEYRVFLLEGNQTLFTETIKEIEQIQRGRITSAIAELLLLDKEGKGKLKNELRSFIVKINEEYLQQAIERYEDLIEEQKRKEEEEKIDKTLIKEAEEFLNKNDLFIEIDQELNKPLRFDYTVRKLLFNVGMSANSNDPINLFLKGESSLGKTYNTTTVMGFFPDEDVWYLGGLTPKALIHDYGTEEDGKKVIELSNKILVFLESPDLDTLGLLKPILSHDKEEIQFKFTDTSQKPMRTVTVIIRGFPATVFCTTEMRLVDELATRGFTATPEASERKYRAVLNLQGDKATYPWLYCGESKEKRVIKQAIKRKSKRNRYCKCALW